MRERRQRAFKKHPQGPTVNGHTGLWHHAAQASHLPQRRAVLCKPLQPRVEHRTLQKLVKVMNSHATKPCLFIFFLKLGSMNLLREKEREESYSLEFLNTQLYLLLCELEEFSGNLIWREEPLKLQRDHHFKASMEIASSWGWFGYHQTVMTGNVPGIRVGVQPWLYQLFVIW